MLHRGAEDLQHQLPCLNKRRAVSLKKSPAKPPKDDLKGLSLDALIDSAEESLGERRTQGQGSLEEEAVELASYRGRLEEIARHSVSDQCTRV